MPVDDDFAAIGLPAPSLAQSDDDWERVWSPRPLAAVAVLATLDVVVGNLTLTDAANAVGVPEAALVAEAEAWEYAAAVNDTFGTSDTSDTFGSDAS